MGLPRGKQAVTNTNNGSIIILLAVIAATEELALRMLAKFFTLAKGKCAALEAEPTLSVVCRGAESTLTYGAALGC